MESLRKVARTGLAKAGLWSFCLAMLVTSALLAAASVASAYPEVGAAATSISLQAPSGYVAGERIVVEVLLTDTSGTPLPGQRVDVLDVSSGCSESALASGSTDGSGVASLQVALSGRVELLARFAGTPQYLPSCSATVTLRPYAVLTKPWTHDEFAYPGQWVPARGTLKPQHSRGSSSTVVVCERRVGAGWVEGARFAATLTPVKGGSAYSARIKFPASGSWRVFALHEDSGHAPSASAARTMRVSDWRRRYRGRRVHSFAAPRKMVAITIDDGPNRRTLQICSILERYGARGTFFFMENLLRHGYMSQAEEVYDRGHEVANHTISHNSLRRPYSVAFNRANHPKRWIRKATGFDPIWVRAAGGDVDSTGLHAVADSDQLYCQWSVSSGDASRRYTPPAHLYSNVVRHVRPGDVILIHQTHPETMQALPMILRELRRRGYQMVTLSELAEASRMRPHH
jgi:peptidoglycan/xylan/chitin deacetylase (PgdA/CDA1 family)